MILLLSTAFIMTITGHQTPQDKSILFASSSEKNQVAKCSVTKDNTIKILYPRSSVPVIRTDNSSFLVAVNTTLTNIIGWKLQLISIFGYFSLSIINHTQKGTIHMFYVESINSSSGLYNLSVTIQVGDKEYTAEEPRAVSIVSGFSNTFSFVVINDIKITPNNPEHEIVFKDAIQQINLLHPTFVLIIGDIVNSIGEAETTTAMEYETFYNLLQKFTVPTFMVPGNHEYYNNGKKYYDKYFGYWPNTLASEQYHNFSFVFGDALFVMIDTGGGNTYVDLTQSQIEWIENTVKTSSAKLKFLVMHVPVFDGLGTDRKRLSDNSQQEIIRIVDTYNVTLVLEGHTHIDKKTVYNNHIYLETTSLGAEARQASDVENYMPHWGYRMIEIANGTVKRFSYGDNPFGDYSTPVYINDLEQPTDYIAIPLLRVTYKYNDIWHNNNTATIASNYNQNFTAAIPFVFPQLPENSSIYVNGSDSFIWSVFRQRTFVFVDVNVTKYMYKKISVYFPVNYSRPHFYLVELTEKTINRGVHIVFKTNVSDELYNVVRVTVYYKVADNGTIKSTELKKNMEDLWEGSSDIFYRNASVLYWIVATNTYGLSSSTIKDIFYVIIYPYMFLNTNNGTEQNMGPLNQLQLLTLLSTFSQYLYLWWLTVATIGITYLIIRYTLLKKKKTQL